MNHSNLSYAGASPTPSLHTNAPGSVLGQPSTSTLWAVIAVLSVCVLAMGSSLVYVSSSKLEALAHAGLPLSSAEVMSAPTSLLSNPSAANNPSQRTSSAIKTEEKRPIAPVKYSSNATKSIANPAPVVGTQAPAATPAPPVASCSNCGTVEAVTPMTRDGQGSGVGAIAGGVIGAVVGNQVGKGSGRTVATVLGAAGGGWAGHTVEKKMKKETVYSVRVRMQDGSSRTVQQKSAPAVGSKVQVDGAVLRPA